jgi:hypothetical protein
LFEAIVKDKSGCEFARLKMGKDNDERLILFMNHDVSKQSNNNGQ